MQDKDFNIKDGAGRLDAALSTPPFRRETFGRQSFGRKTFGCQSLGHGMFERGTFGRNTFGACYLDARCLSTSHLDAGRL